ncbi:type IV pilus modification protein PilV [Ferrigenium kumadai]|uniref:Type IV pilus modification protein PilV n=1 Tax=Ferrigenium kumadai TaxID=1682490 RepID=A0AAN1SXD2_9PROT|nr:type IV pilus modification protein PilV [Ferrigenium kumadai]BBI98332.1 type IV pilus modification protein PilV [Ferrigenium kumadai]
MRCYRCPQYPTTFQRGFSMLEILITLVIIATALLGTAGLQMYAMRVGQSGHLRTQAVFLASDIAERMEANRGAATIGSYAVGATNTPSVVTTDCSTTACNEASLAAFDISQWENTIAGTLPQSSWEITQDITGNPSTYTIRVSWSDRSSVSTTHGETFSYTATRTVRN